MPPLLLSATVATALSTCGAQHWPSWLHGFSVLGVNVSIVNFLNTYGYLAVFLFIGIENLGVPFPGETMLVAASVYAAQACGLQEPYVIAACILGSVVGSTAGYWVGCTGGRGLLRTLHVSDKHLGPAEAYFARYGGATVFFGRFLAVLRAWASFLAGVNHMHTGRFLIYNSAGAIIWSITFGMLGFLLGKHLDQLQKVLTELGTGGAIAVALVVVVALAAFWLRRHRQRGVVIAAEQVRAASRVQPVRKETHGGAPRITEQLSLPHTLAVPRAEEEPPREGMTSGPLHRSAPSDAG